MVCARNFDKKRRRETHECVSTIDAEIVSQNKFPSPFLIYKKYLTRLQKVNQIFFTLCDLKSRYHQILLDPATKEKTGFVTHQGLFHYTRLPYGLVNAPVSFQSLVAGIFRNMTQDYVLVYIDDVLICSCNIKDHLKHLQNTFDKLKQANFRLNPAKCHFALDKISYSGHIITPTAISTDPHKILAVQEFPAQPISPNYAAF